MNNTTLVLMLMALLWAGTASASDAATCDTAEFQVKAEALTPMDHEALRQRIEMLEAQGRKLRGLVEQRLLPRPEASRGENRVHNALMEELRSTEAAILCLEEVENASMEARLELLRKYLDSVRANAR